MATAPRSDAATRVAWLERFYDIVFVACVGRFANELGTNPDLAHSLVVLAWLAGLWLSWMLVTVRLNRFPDEQWGTRSIVVAQLMCTTIAAVAAVSPTGDDSAGGLLATAGISLGVAALYATVQRADVVDVRLLTVPIAGSLALCAATLSALVVPLAVALTLAAAVALGFLVVVFGFYLTRLTESQPVEPHHAGDRHGQLFLVLMGLSFVKVAFATDPVTGVDYAAVVGAFLVGFSLWILYIDGVLPLGFPLEPSRQRTWLLAQFLLALAITVAAAAVTAVPVTESGAVSTAGALLEGGSFTLGLLALAMLAISAQRPAGAAAGTRALAAAAAAALTAAALVVEPSAGTFSVLLGAVVVLAAAAEVLRQRTRRR